MFNLKPFKASEFEPKIISALKEGYPLKTFLKDVLAGIIVGIVALPLSIAIAIASGVKPEQGLITAAVAGFLISLFSGSRFQIGGPTAAFIIIVYGIVQQYGYDGLAAATLMAGVLLVILGAFRFGDMIKFIPYPVIVGFTGGIAVILFTSQIRDLFGLNIPHMPEHFIEKWKTYFEYIPTTNISALVLSSITVVITVLWPKVTKRLPGPLIAIILTTWMTRAFHLNVETIGSRFGEVPNVFPSPHMPHLNYSLFVTLIKPAFTIALLAGIESLLSAVVADGMTGRKHRSNMELIAQGIANIVSPIFNGIPATGAIARTATNIKNGGQTPIAGMVHAAVVLILFLVLGKMAALIPMATLAGILVVVAYNMMEWHLFIRILKTTTGDVFILMNTFLLTVLVDLTVAIEVGMVLSAFLFMHRVVDLTDVDNLTDQTEDDPDAIRKDIPQGIEIFEINGPFFFGAADKFRDTLREFERKPKVLIIGLRHVPAIDATGLRAFEDIIDNSRRDNTKILFFGASSKLIEILNKMGFMQKISADLFFPSVDEALEQAKKII